MQIDLLRMEELSVLFSENNTKILNKSDKNKCILLNYYIQLSNNYNMLENFSIQDILKVTKSLHWFLSENEITMANDWLKRKNYIFFDYNTDKVYGMYVNFRKIFENMYIKTGKMPHLQGFCTKLNIDEKLKTKQLKYSKNQIKKQLDILRKENLKMQSEADYLSTTKEIKQEN